MIRRVPDRIVQLVPAETGWHAFYGGVFEEDAESTRVVARALVEQEDGEREVIGLVAATDDPTQVVPAPEGGSAVVTGFVRYGFRPPSS